MWRYFHPSSEEDQKAHITWPLIRRVLGYARPRRGLILAMLILILVQTVLGLINPLIFRQLIDVTLPAGDAQALNVLALLLIVLPVITSVVSVIIRRLNATVGEGVIYDLRVQLYDHLQRMPLRFFTHTRSGELMSRLNNDVVNAQTAISDTIVGIITNTIRVILTLIVMLSLSVPMTLLGLGVMPLFYLAARQIGSRLRTLARTMMNTNAEMNAMMSETLNVSGALLTKLMGRTELESRRFSNRAGKVRDIGIQRAYVGSLFWAVLGMVGVVGTAIVYLVGGHQVLAGVFSVGTIVAFAAYLSQIYGPLEYLVSAPVEFATSMVSFERVFEIIDMPSEIVEQPDAVELTEVQGELAFERVSFQYESGSAAVLSEVKRYGRHESVGGVLTDDPAPAAEVRPPTNGASQARLTALEDISFTAHPGQFVAVVGPSGAGKTTLSYLIPRLYDPTGGRILLDGHDLRDLTLSSLASHIGMVTQETYLFHDTVRANLLYARPDATQAQIEDAARAANIHDFILGLDKGYETIVGERGYRLSGGEKQRIAIARVVLRDPRVLVLDEATSHLDSQSESLIQDALEKLMTTRTSLVIAHRLSTIMNADLILVMDRGRVVERGTHAELLEQGGVYARLVEIQMGDRAEA
jgi:ATP-binding cassette subfamily B protein